VEVEQRMRVGAGRHKSYLAIGPTNEAIWDMEDEQLLAAIRKHIAELSDRATKRA